jgi:hypothetical protein
LRQDLGRNPKVHLPDGAQHESRFALEFQIFISPHQLLPDGNAGQEVAKMVQFSERRLHIRMWQGAGVAVSIRLFHAAHFGIRNATLAQHYRIT